MVVNVGKVLGGDWKYVSWEIDAINRTVVQNRSSSKMIISTVSTL